jgi:amino acid transporter
MESLKRRLTLLQATAINMIDMVGIGPFVVLPLVIREFHSPLFIWAWVAGAVLALIDGAIWSELGAAYPLAGGSYNFLRIAYGPKWGRLMSFLFVWQTAIQAPMVLASGSIGFATYLRYLAPVIEPWQQKAVSVLVILFVTALLYRKIETVGRLSLFLWGSVLLTMGWIIAGGLLHHDPGFSLPVLPAHTSDIFSTAFLFPLAYAGQKTVYSYLGYYNVCHLGSEIKNPEKNIPRSIFISIIGIAVLYLCMNISIVSVIPWQEAQQFDFVISVFMEKAFGGTAARMATGLVLVVAFSSLFAVLLGYSRVPYAAAKDGNFFKVFGRLHPTKDFPHISLLFIAGLAIVFSFFFSLKQVISAILAMRILVQFIAQAIGVMRLREKNGTKGLPFKMWLYPLPVIVSVLIWLALFVSTKMFAVWGTCMALAGVVVFYIKENSTKKGADAPEKFSIEEE